MKKMYKKPVVEMSEALLPMAIVCASFTEGDPVPQGGTMYTD